MIYDCHHERGVILLFVTFKKNHFKTEIEKHLCIITITIQVNLSQVTIRLPPFFISLDQLACGPLRKTFVIACLHSTQLGLEGNLSFTMHKGGSVALCIEGIWNLLFIS